MKGRRFKTEIEIKLNGTRKVHVGIFLIFFAPSAVPVFRKRPKTKALTILDRLPQHFHFVFAMVRNEENAVKANNYQNRQAPIIG